MPKIRRKKGSETTIELKDPKEIVGELNLQHVVELVPGMAYRGVREGTYYVIEPPLPGELASRMLEVGKEYVLARVRPEQAEYMERVYERAAETAIKEAGVKLKGEEGDKARGRLRDYLTYYLRRDIEGLGPIEPVMRDPHVEDLTLPARGSRRLYVYLGDLGDWFRSNIRIEEEEAKRIVLKLAELVGKQVSLAEPRLEGRLPDGSRVHALYGEAASSGGTVFTIRKFVVRPTIEKLILWGAISLEATAYLWTLLDHGISGFIAGETGTGKTTLLNSLLSLLPRRKHIVTVEDTAEIFLPEHENWTSLLGTPPGMGPKGLTIVDLLRDVLRMRPDYVVVGESRGEETRLLLQFINVGHTSLTTFHSDTLEGVVRRLMSDPINMTVEEVASFKVAVLLRRRGKKRGVVRIAEILATPERDRIVFNDVFTRPGGLEGPLVGDPLPKSVLFSQIAEQEGIPKEVIVEEFFDKAEELLRRVGRFSGREALVEAESAE